MITQLEPSVSGRLKASLAQVAEFCQRWQITELALFGSILRSDFRPDSDIDVLVSFADGYRLTWDNWLKMQAEIETLLGRKVDLIKKKYLKNPYRRAAILKTCQVLYASEQS